MIKRVNTFEKGMYLNSLESNQPEGTYRIAVNAMDQSEEHSGFGIVNEQSHKKVATFSGKIVGKSFIEERNQSLIFVSNGSSELHLFDHKTEQVTLVCKDSDFGCNWGFSDCEFLYGEFKNFNKCRELHVYWSSDCTYHVVNIDEMLDADRKAAILTCNDCTYFDLFVAVCTPHISAIPTRNNASGLEAGSYAIAVQLKDSDGSETNIFEISRFANAESEDNVGGQPSKSSIKFNISNLDKRFNRVIIYIIKNVKGVITVEKLPARSYSTGGITFEYNGQKGELLPPSVLTVKHKAYLKGQDCIQKGNVLYLYNLKNEKNLNYQKYANNIQIGFVEREVSIDQCAKYHYPSLLRGEVYAFGIVWKFADGTYSPVYHIPAGGGGASIFEERAETQLAVSTGYKPLTVGSLDTSDQFQRLRNPSDIKDRRLESDKLENAVEQDVQNIDTEYQDVIDAAACHDNLYDCSTAETVYNQDLSDVMNTFENNAELLSKYGIDKEDPDLNQTTSLKDAYLDLLKNVVKDREYIKRKKPVLTYTGAQSPAPGTPPTPPSPEATILAATARGDNWTDGTGNNLTDEEPRIVNEGSMLVYNSSVEYPCDTDCDGQRFYPQGNIRFHRIPYTSTNPHFRSLTNGVENQYQPDNHPFAKTYVRLMGIKAEGVQIPSDNELPKPLCPTSPYKIVYVKRTNENKSIFAKGWLSGTFNGTAYGTNFVCPRNGVNSFESVDESINAGNDSKLGTKNSDPIYTFHSLDTDANQTPLPVNKIRGELALKGSGWKYGLSAEGKKPEDQYNGTRKDIGGCRVANNLNHYDGSGSETTIKGITFAPAHEAGVQTDGISKPLMNKFRESSVFLEAGGVLPGSNHDKSWIGGVIDHFSPTECNAPYASLIREVPDQYGSVEGLMYADLGVHATTKHLNGETLYGICGDTFVGPSSKKRTAYVSSKRGNFFNPPKKPLGDCRPKSWCDTPEDKVFDYLGINNYPTKLPKSGDIYDPKNYAGLHTVAGDCGEYGRSKKDSEAPTNSESDFYWPRTLTSLVHTIIECENNPYLRETGEGDQKKEGKVFYGRLKGLHLDANAPASHPWEDSWLTRFHTYFEQPSIKQLAKKAAIRSFLLLGFPALTFLSMSQMDAIMGPVISILTAAGMNTAWLASVNTFFNNDRLNQIFRLGECARDEEGGNLDGNIEGFEDNYTAFNADYNKVNDIFPHVAFPLPFNTCDCSECETPNLNGDIYWTNTQNIDSDIDAYKNVKVNNYLNTQGHHGKLSKLFIKNNELNIHMTKGLGRIQVNPLTVPNDVVLQRAGDGSMLSEAQMIMEEVKEGFFGTHHPNSAISTPYGYFFIDDKSLDVCVYGNGVQKLGGGISNFLKEGLKFCDEKSCIDEKSSSGNHYSLGWNPRYNILYITKFDGENSFTVSCRPNGEDTKWISFHSWIPRDYHWDRQNCYGITDNEIWKFNDKGNFLNFLDGKGEFLVDVVANAGGQDFLYETTSLNTLAEVNGKRDLDITFNKLGIFNDTQSTGLRPLEVQSDNNGKIKDILGRIKFNPTILTAIRDGKRFKIANAKDLVNNDCAEEEILIKNECDPIGTLNDSIIDCKNLKEQEFRNRNFKDDYIAYRFIFDNDHDTRLYLRSISTEIKGEGNEETINK